MIVEVVVGCVLIVLGLCALLGLPALAFRLYEVDRRSHEIEQRVVADVRNVLGRERRDVERDMRHVERHFADVDDVDDDDAEPLHTIGGLPERGDA
jgi:hypothetical protein